MNSGSNTIEGRIGDLYGIFERLCGNPRFSREYPALAGSVRRLRQAHRDGDVEAQEEHLTALYSRLHAENAEYNKQDLARLKALDGYWCYAGGLAPLVEAARFLTPGMTVVDLGAGNGLQGLLLQSLVPHERTIQVELSRRMIRRGRVLQELLEIPDERVTWIQGDIGEFDVAGIDLVYLYRPARPEGRGERLYRDLAARLAAVENRVIVVSVADCLGPFLDRRFTCLSDTGHTKVYTNSPVDRATCLNAGFSRSG